MIKSISRMPIFRRLLIAFGLAVVVPGIVIVLLGSYYVNQLTIRGQAVEVSFQAQNTAFEEQVNLQRMNALLQARHAQVFASVGGNIQDPSLKASGQLINDDILARELDFSQTLEQYQNNFNLTTSSNMTGVRTILLNDNPNTGLISAQSSALNAVIHQQWPAYKALQDQELVLLQNNASYAQAYKVLFEADASFTNLRNSWQNIVQIAQNLGEVVTAVGPSQINPIVFGDILALLISTGFVVTVGYIMNITITRPLRHLATLTKRIAKGETSARAMITSHDEIYLVATSMNNMLDNIVHLIQEVQSQRDKLQAQVENLVSEVSGIGEGDLRVEAEVTADALGVLADSFNYMVQELGALIVRVKLVAQDVETTTALILDRMAQLVENDDTQIQQIANASAGVEHMANFSHQVANRAQVLSTMARETRSNVQNGRNFMQQAIEGMGRIYVNVQETSSKVQVLGERSREIDEIVSAISNIAYQTNRLALDAAIQSAMAGENGKGFGAVAADIRRLAERTKELAGTVGHSVRSVREDISAVATATQVTERETAAGTRLIQESSSTLGSIFSTIEHLAGEIETINLMANQQLQASASIVQIMQGVSGTTQQNGISVREASHSMERLARLVEQLRASSDAFKLREDLSYYTSSPQFNAASVEQEQDSQMTISGVFRTVTRANSNDRKGLMNHALTPRVPDPVGSYQWNTTIE